MQAVHRRSALRKHGRKLLAQRAAGTEQLILEITESVTAEGRGAPAGDGPLAPAGVHDLASKTSAPDRRRCRLTSFGGRKSHRRAFVSPMVDSAENRRDIRHYDLLSGSSAGGGPRAWRRPEQRDACLVGVRTGQGFMRPAAAVPAANDGASGADADQPVVSRGWPGREPNRD